MTRLRLAVLVMVGLQTLSLSACHRTGIKVPRPDAGADADLGSARDGVDEDGIRDVLSVEEVRPDLRWDVGAPPADPPPADAPPADAPPADAPPADAPPADAPAAAVLAVEPASAVLRAVVVGPYVTPLDPVVLTVKNTGGAATGTLQVGLAGPNASDFRIDADACSGLALPAQGSCAVTVFYVPPASAVWGGEASLVVTDLASGESATATLHGQIVDGDCPTLTGGPDLGNVAPGAVGREVLFTVSNSCPAFEMSVLGVSVTPPADIRISTDTCTNHTLAPLGTCTVGLQLAPPKDALSRSVAAILTVNTDVGSAAVQVTAIPGSGGAALAANPSSINFGAIPVGQASTPHTVRITNNGPVASGLLTISFSGVGREQLAVVGTTCNGALSPGSSCQITVYYLPLDTAGVSATMTVTDGTWTASIPIAGRGVSVAQDASVDTDRGVDGEGSG